MQWFWEQPYEVQAVFDATVGILRRIEDPDDWEKSKAFKVLTGRHRGLSEIRFSVNGDRQGKPIVRRFRPVGIWRPDEREFIFLLGCEKFRYEVTEPANTFDRALELMARLADGRGTLDEHD